MCIRDSHQTPGVNFGTLRQRMRRRADHLQLVIAANLALQAGVVHQGFDQSDIQRMRGDGIADRLGIGNGQPRPDLRVTHVELAEDRRQHELGDRGTRTHQQTATHLSGHFGDAEVEVGG